MSRKKVILLMTLCMTTLLASCMQIEEQEEITLYVQAYLHSYSDFMQTYGIPFELEHDNIRVEVSEYTEEAAEYADLLYLYGFTNYEQFVADNKLAPLDGWITGQDQIFSNMGLAQSKGIELLREYSEDQLFALPFKKIHSSALYYNVDLFDAYDVEYPPDIITWEEVFQLASQFPMRNDAGQKIFGLTHNTTSIAPMPNGEETDADVPNEGVLRVSGNIAYSYIISVARAANISMWNDQWEMTMNTPEWEQILNDTIPGMQAGYIDINLIELNFIGRGHPFRDDGRAAMYVSDLSTAEYLARQSEDEAFRWNVVAGPIHPGHPVTNNYNVSRMYGINNQSVHQEEAWQLLKFMFEQSFPSDEIAGVSLEMFYVLDSEKYNIYPDLPVNVVELRGMITRILHEVVEDRLSIKDALVQIQEEGQQMLDNQRFDYENSITGEEAHE